MASVNKVILIGNLGRDPETRYMPDGGAVANVSIATTDTWKDKNGEKQEKTEWHKCVAWNGGGKGTGLADIIERYVKKGDKIFVEGAIEYRQYEDKDKQTRYITEINVREILLLGGGRGGEGGFDGGSRPARGPSSGKSAGAGEGFEEFPAAMDGDDDLPF